MELYVQETGSQDAPSIVFLHGGGLSGRMWQPQVQQLIDYHCIIPDLPEQGRSTALTPFSLDGAAQLVAALIERHCVSKRAHLVGLSLGGAVALTVLRRTPAVVDRVIVSGTAAGLSRIIGGISKSSARLYRFISAQTLVNASIRQFAIPPEYQQLVRQDLLQGTNETFIRHYTDALMGMSLPVGSQSPVLVAVGERETWIAKQAARKIVATVPHAQGTLAPNVGHVWNLQAPELFTAMIRAWCEGAPLPSALRPL